MRFISTVAETRRKCWRRWAASVCAPCSSAMRGPSVPRICRRSSARRAAIACSRARAGTSTRDCCARCPPAFRSASKFQWRKSWSRWNARGGRSRRPKHCSSNAHCRRRRRPVRPSAYRDGAQGADVPACRGRRSAAGRGFRRAVLRAVHRDAGQGKTPPPNPRHPPAAGPTPRETGACRPPAGTPRGPNPLIERAREVGRGGRIGRLAAVAALWLLQKPADYFDVAWRREAGGGPLLINLIHDIDDLRYICGEIAEVRAITANAARGFPVEDSAAVTLRFANGAVGSATVSDAVPAPWSWELASGENPVYPQQPENCYFFSGTSGSLALPRVDPWRSGARSGWDAPPHC